MTAEAFWNTPLSRFIQLIKDTNKKEDTPITREKLVRNEREINRRWAGNT